MNYLQFSELDENLLQQYRNAKAEAFPKIILTSKVMKNCWEKLEKYFPQLQIFLVDVNNQLIGFMNTVAFFWVQPLDELPDEGWDWLVQKSITDHENNIRPNAMGGLQIIVIRKHQGQGFSKLLIAAGKKVKEKFGFQHFIIPIRPILKHQHPEIPMKKYMLLQKDNSTYDPWIRTHLNSGAKIIKVCENSMNVAGDIPFWETMIEEKISRSGNYFVKGALNTVVISIEKNYGEYKEENIWIHY